MDQMTTSPDAAVPNAAVKATVAETFAEVAHEHGVTLGALDADTPLFGMALDSLCLAVIVARLEVRLGVDPFAAEDLVLPASFGDFVTLYERAGPAAPAVRVREGSPGARAGA